MNYPFVIAGAILALAFLAHALVGSRESLTTRPTEEKTDVVRNWVQSMCAFQMITVDLFLLAVLLFFLGMSSGIPFKREMALGVSVLFAMWGIAWLIQMILLRRPGRDYLLLGQWIAWFVCSALLFWGAHIETP